MNKLAVFAFCVFCVVACEPAGERPLIEVEAWQGLCDENAELKDRVESLEADVSELEKRLEQYEGAAAYERVKR